MVWIDRRWVIPSFRCRECDRSRPHMKYESNPYPFFIFLNVAGPAPLSIVRGGPTEDAMCYPASKPTFTPSPRFLVAHLVLAPGSTERPRPLELSRSVVVTAGCGVAPPPRVSI